MEHVNFASPSGEVISIRVRQGQRCVIKTYIQYRSPRFYNLCTNQIMWIRFVPEPQAPKSISLGLQVPSEEVFAGGLEGPNTF